LASFMRLIIHKKMLLTKVPIENESMLDDSKSLTSDNSPNYLKPSTNYKCKCDMIRPKEVHSSSLKTQNLKLNINNSEKKFKQVSGPSPFYWKR